MIEKIKSIFTPAVRGWLYRAGIGVVIALGGYGLLSENDVAVTVTLLAALFGHTVASLNSPVGKQPE